MNFLVDNLLLIAIAVASGAMAIWPLLRARAGGPSLGTLAATQLMNSRDVQIVDVRSAAEFGSGTLRHARNIPLPDVAEQAPNLPKDKPAIVVCETGRRASRRPSSCARRGSRRSSYWRADFRPGVLPGCRSTSSRYERGNTMSARVRMYSTAYCGYCRRAEALLLARGVKDIEKLAVDQDPQLLAEMVQKTGRRTVPQIFINEHHVGGYDELAAIDRKGTLQELLAGYRHRARQTGTQVLRHGSGTPAYRELQYRTCCGARSACSPHRGNL